MKLIAFLKERFPAGPYLVLVGLTIAVSGADVLAKAWHPATLIAGLVLFLLFFFRLRLFDEIKDYETDVKWRPERIVARGDVSLADIRQWLGITVLAELLILMWMPGPVQFWYLVAAAWSVLMYFEFFIPKWLERHFVIYGLTHVMVMAPLALAMRGLWLPQSGPALQQDWALMLGITGAGYLFEIGRKLRRPEEEQQGVDTYSGKLGQPLATGWFVLWIGITWWAFSITFPQAIWFTGILAGIAAVYTAFHIHATALPVQKPVELLSSIFVILLYVSILVVNNTMHLPGPPPAGGYPW